MGRSRDEHVGDGADLFGKGALQGVVGGVGRLLPVGGDDAHDGLGFAEVQLAVQEGPLRELSRTRRLGARREDSPQNALHEVHAAVALEFHDVLAGVGGRRPEHEADGLVDGGGCPVGRFDDGAKEHGVPGYIAQGHAFFRRKEHFGSNGQCIAPGNADDANAARRIRRRNGRHRAFCHGKPSFS